jgi:dolichol-phosphate mannosyltransferase
MVEMTYPKSLDVIVPFYNEEAAIAEFHKRLVGSIERLEIPTRFFYIDDGSVDNTLKNLLYLMESDDRINVIQLSRNFGHQAALTAGLDLVDADIVITLDGDGEHPPELIPVFVDLYLQGYDVVQGQRMDNDLRPSQKKLTSRWFYSIINFLGNTKIAEGTSDFRLMTKKVVEAYRQVHDYHRFIRGIIPWLGFSETLLQYRPGKRISGKSKYSLSKMFTLAENAIFSFSIVPLRIGLSIGLFFFLLAFVEVVYVTSFWIAGKQEQLAPGWSSIVFLILITGGALMILISIIGIYIGQISQQVKNRPIYIIREKYSK